MINQKDILSSVRTSIGWNTAHKASSGLCLVLVRAVDRDFRVEVLHCISAHATHTAQKHLCCLRRKINAPSHVADSWLLQYCLHHMTIVAHFKEGAVLGLQNSSLHHKFTYIIQQTGTPWIQHALTQWAIPPTVTGMLEGMWVHTRYWLFCEWMISVLVCATDGPPAAQQVQRSLWLRKEPACRQLLAGYTGIVPSVPVHSKGGRWEDVKVGTHIHNTQKCTCAHKHSGYRQLTTYSESGRGCGYASWDTDTPYSTATSTQQWGSLAYKGVYS